MCTTGREHFYNVIGGKSDAKKRKISLELYVCPRPSFYMIYCGVGCQLRDELLFKGGEGGGEGCGTRESKRGAWRRK